jgi:hypothetical protein
MAGHGGGTAAAAARVEAAFTARRLRFAPDPFWSGPRFLWQLPAHLRAELASARMVILKGDANYRRLIGDALWPPSAPFEQACAFFPAPIACLRTMKSDAVLGLAPGMAEELDGADPEWRINGRRGLIQTYVPDAARRAS